MNKREKICIVSVFVLVIAFVITLVVSIIVGNMESQKALDNFKTNIANISEIEVYEFGSNDAKVIITDKELIQNIIVALQESEITKISVNIVSGESTSYKLLFKTPKEDMMGSYTFESGYLSFDSYSLKGSFKVLDDLIEPLIIEKQNYILDEFAKFLNNNKDIKKGIVDYEVKNNNLYIVYNDKIKESDLSDIVTKTQEKIPSINGVIANPEEGSKNRQFSWF